VGAARDRRPGERVGVVAVDLKRPGGVDNDGRSKFAKPRRQFRSSAVEGEGKAPVSRTEGLRLLE